MGDRKIGAIVHATHQGLGVLARSFYDSGVIDEVLIEQQRRYPIHPEWYSDSRMYSEDHVTDFLSSISALLIFEKLRNWTILERARRRGIPATLMPMYEWTPQPLPLEPDRYLCPSPMEFDYYAHKGPAAILPVPVDVPHRRRRRAKLFVHNAGNVESAERNGTLELLAAIPRVRSRAKFLIRMQHSPLNAKKENYFMERYSELLERCVADTRVEFIHKTVPYDRLWSEGDVFVFPEKYNGLSLPLQEAFASGMLVMGSDRYPMNTWLPPAPLIPVRQYVESTMAVRFRRACIDPADVAHKIDQFFGVDISEYSEAGRKWAEAHSWEKWKNPYRRFILEPRADSNETLPWRRDKDDTRDRCE